MLGRGALGLAVAAAALSLFGCDHQRLVVAPEQTESPRLAGSPPMVDLRERFDLAVSRYREAARDGWSAAECEHVAASFEEASAAFHQGMPEALFDAGVAWMGCARSDEAARRFESADRSARARGQVGFAPALIQLGAMAYRRGDRAGARQLFDRARQSDRRSAEAYVNLAMIQREEGQWAEAQSNIRRALAVNSGQMVAFTQMALLYLELSRDVPQRLDLAALVCQQAIERAHQLELDEAVTAPLQNLWGIALLRQGDVARAVERFDAARRLQPDLYEAHMNFGAVNLSFRGFTAAEQAFRRAVALSPESYEAHLSLGAALRGLGRFVEARGAYEAARELDRGRPDAHYNLAVLQQDYLLGQADTVEEQLALLQAASQALRRFLTACESQDTACRRPDGEGGRDWREMARRRLEACQTLSSSLAEATEEQPREGSTKRGR